VFFSSPKTVHNRNKPTLRHHFSSIPHPTNPMLDHQNYVFFSSPKTFHNKNKPTHHHHFFSIPHPLQQKKVHPHPTNPIYMLDTQNYVFFSFLKTFDNKKQLTIIYVDK